MIKCYLLEGSFKEQNFDDFNVISKSINDNRNKLSDMGLDIIIELLNNLGKKIIQDKSINQIPGVSYASLWLKKDNLKKICNLNYFSETYHEGFEKVKDNMDLAAQPRGIVCHWVAYTIPTLAFFSLMQSILSKNGSVVKTPVQNKDIILSILKNLNELEAEIGGKTYFGKDIVSSISIVSFEGKNLEISSKFSMIADCRIVWGGSEAIKSVSSLPVKEHCETINFGPKYSFGVFDKEFIEKDEKSFSKSLENSAMDIVMFNQMACSSPHVLFFEKSKYSIDEISQKIKKIFENFPKRLIEQDIDQGTAARIINSRGVYSLDNNKNLLQSNDLSWTILINAELSLEDPIQGKCIFLKEVENIYDTIGLITRKVQAISVSIFDEQRKKDFAMKASHKGADRIVVPGHIHDFDIPWDGILALNRLVRWTILKK
jgi:hypothetical protein